MRRQEYQQVPNRSGRGSYQNNQPVYYISRGRHHWFLGLIGVIIVLICGWLLADHYLGDSEPQNTSKTTVNRTIVKNPKNPKQHQVAQPTKQPNIGKLENEMNRLKVTAKDQQTAINFYQKQSLKNQTKMIKMIGLVNKVVPSMTMKRKVLQWILS